jgi:DNA repair protein RadC
LYQLHSDDDVLMHNHPSGDPTPSQEGVQMTKSIVDIAGPLGIAVHNHIIVGKSRYSSLRGPKLM